MRTRRYLYVEHATGEHELYDVVADPAETTNLAGTMTALVCRIRPARQGRVVISPRRRHGRRARRAATPAAANPARTRLPGSGTGLTVAGLIELPLPRGDVGAVDRQT